MDPWPLAFPQRSRTTGLLPQRPVQRNVFISFVERSVNYISAPRLSIEFCFYVAYDTAGFSKRPNAVGRQLKARPPHSLIMRLTDSWSRARTMTDEARLYGGDDYKPDFSSPFFTVALAVAGCSLGAWCYASFRVAIALTMAFH
jgi:hypothetical protein